MSDHLFETSVVELVKTKFDAPMVFGGFIGPGLVGPVTAGYIIEKLNLHEIAHVRSQHIPPVAVFIGGRLRHPFRIYCDATGKLVVIMSEMPIDMEGLYEISSVLIDWFQKIHAREVVLLEGLGVNEIPVDRETVFVADEEKAGYLISKGIKPMESALIGGVGGSILNQCLSRRIPSLSLMTLASVDLPDPGAALTIINSVNSIYNLRIATDELEESSKRLNEQLGKLADQYRKLTENNADPDKRLYG
ncbi:MAG: PAC2 family protein [Nitrososphaerales archaeon]